MVEQTIQSNQQAFDDFTKLRTKLIRERDAKQKAIKTSPEYLALEAREKELDEQCKKLSAKIGNLSKEIRMRFLSGDNEWVHYSRADSWRISGGTNIRPHVLSAISKVTPISKLTEENVKDTVKMLIVMANRKHAGLEKLKEQNYPIDKERRDIEAKRWALERNEEVYVLDTLIRDLSITLSSLEEKIQHPERVKKRYEAESARERIKRPDILNSILSDIEKHEEKA